MRLLRKSRNMRWIIPEFELEFTRKNAYDQIPAFSAFSKSLRKITYSNTAITRENILSQRRTVGETLQARLTSTLTKDKFQQFIESIDDKQSLIAVTAVKDEHAHRWMITIPTREELQMTDATVAVALRRRYNMDQSISPSAVSCNCGQYGALDKKGQHLLNCIKDDGRHTTHNTLVGAFAQMCNHAGIANKVEPQNVFVYQQEPTGKRPDIKISPGQLGPRGYLLDVTVTSPSSGRNGPNAAGQSRALCTTPGWALKRAEDKKKTKYTELCRQNDFNFLPLAIESTGMLSKATIDLVQKISDKASEIHKIPSHVLFNYHMNHLSVLLQKMTAQAMLRRSASLHGASLSPYVRHMMSYHNIMCHDIAHVGGEGR